MAATQVARSDRSWPRMPAPSRFVSILLVTSIISCMAGFVYLVQYHRMLFPLLAVAGLLMAFFVIVRPEIGFVALIMCAAMVRVAISTGTGTPIVASLIVACLLIGGWIVHRLLGRKRLILLPRSIGIPATMLVGATLFSIFWGRVSLDPRIVYTQGFLIVQVAAASLTVVSVGLLFAGADLLRERRIRTIICGVIVAVGIIALPYRAMGAGVPFVNTAGLFGIWFVAICWAHALVNDRLPDIVRVCSGALAIGWLVMAMTKEQSWVSGWVPPLIALLAVTVAARPRLGFLFVLLGIVGGAFYNSLFYSMLVTQQQRDGSLDGEFGRLQLWQRNLEVVSDHLLFGTGPAGYALYYLTFVPDHAMSTHSNYVDVLAQSGVFGLIGLVSLLGCLWLLGRDVLRRTWHAVDRATTAAIVGGIPAVAASLWLGDWLIPFVYNQTLAGFDHAVYSWLMFAMLCGLYAQSHRERVPDV